ncbi:MAG: ribonuclease P protein component [Bacteroidales bacterium]|nr:ribonuclease P protein component [Bacteroidales bacterium]
MTFGLGKHERLCAGRLIDALHTEGQRLNVYPMAVRWMVCPDETFSTPAQVMFVAPKRKLHHATDRNRAKRLMRECYRLRKPELYRFLTANNIKIALSLSYMHNQPMSYATLSGKFDKVMAQLEKSLVPQCTD